MPRVQLLQYSITTAEENRLLRATIQAQNAPAANRLRVREKMGGAKTGAEAKAAILAKRAKAQAEAEERQRKEAFRKRKREERQAQAEERKRRRQEKSIQAEEQKRIREEKKEAEAEAKKKKMQEKTEKELEKKKQKEVKEQQKKALRDHQERRQRRIARLPKNKKERCQICRKGNERATEYARCRLCHGRYHVACLRRGTQPFVRGQKWSCFACMTPV